MRAADAPLGERALAAEPDATGALTRWVPDGSSSTRVVVSRNCRPSYCSTRIAHRQVVPRAHTRPSSSGSSCSSSCRLVVRRALELVVQLVVRRRGLTAHTRRERDVRLAVPLVVWLGVLVSRFACAVSRSPPALALEPRGLALLRVLPPDPLTRALRRYAAWPSASSRADARPRASPRSPGRRSAPPAAW